MASIGEISVYTDDIEYEDWLSYLRRGHNKLRVYGTVDPHPDIVCGHLISFEEDSWNYEEASTVILEEPLKVVRCETTMISVKDKFKNFVKKFKKAFEKCWVTIEDCEETCYCPKKHGERFVTLWSIEEPFKVKYWMFKKLIKQK